MHALSLPNKALLSWLFVACKRSGDAVNARRFAVRKAATYEWLLLAALQPRTDAVETPNPFITTTHPSHPPSAVVVQCACGFAVEVPRGREKFVRRGGRGIFCWNF